MDTGDFNFEGTLWVYNNEEYCYAIFIDFENQFVNGEYDNPLEKAAITFSSDAIYDLDFCFSGGYGTPGNPVNSGNSLVPVAPSLIYSIQGPYQLYDDETEQKGYMELRKIYFNYDDESKLIFEVAYSTFPGMNKRKDTITFDRTYTL